MNLKNIISDILNFFKPKPKLDQSSEKSLDELMKDMGLQKQKSVEVKPIIVEEPITVPVPAIKVNTPTIIEEEKSVNAVKSNPFRDKLPMNTLDVFLKLGASPEVAKAGVDVCSHFGITSSKEISAFIGQMMVESGNFSTVSESLNYGADALIKMFSRSRISIANALKYGRVDTKVRQRLSDMVKQGKLSQSNLQGLTNHSADQQAIANTIYGGPWGLKNLGNRIGTTDGWDYRGRGFKQLTGLYNFTEFSRAYCGDDTLVKNPQLVEQLPYSMASAGWFWSRNHLSQKVKEGASIEAITKIVNGGDNGLNQRIAGTNKAQKLFDQMVA